jgi:hypothetical protein
MCYITVHKVIVGPLVFPPTSFYDHLNLIWVLIYIMEMLILYAISHSLHFIWQLALLSVVYAECDNGTVGF